VKRDVPAVAGLALAGVFLSLLWLEHRRPLRARTRPEPPRLARNLAAGAAAAVVVGLTEAPITRRLAQHAQQRQLGLVYHLGLPRPARDVLALVLLDYTLYLWHILLHRVPALWRWHQVHHRDADLDVSTAVRFHGMELLWSVPWRAAQVVLIGVNPRLLQLWGQLTLAEVMFHHSNLRLPAGLERLLEPLVVTPARHGVHHADREDLQHGNFSSGLAVWDHLHGTASQQIPQDRITIGLPDETSRP
jgi:sterol desaturase/sphingolipid hydroxylase (fatty acid hydroxylase superfamily)